MHSQGEELAVGKPGMLIQVWGITWLRKLAQVGVRASWARQACFPPVHAWSTGWG